MSEVEKEFVYPKSIKTCEKDEMNPNKNRNKALWSTCKTFTKWILSISLNWFSLLSCLVVFLFHLPFLIDFILVMDQILIVIYVDSYGWSWGKAADRNVYGIVYRCRSMENKKSHKNVNWFHCHALYVRLKRFNVQRCVRIVCVWWAK